MKLRACSPGFFEKIVVKLLQAMGYGGVTGEALVTGRSGDAGIDGIIKEDKLGLDVVCIQAKRWENATVGRPVIQGFVGSMDFVRARKGVILTTSQFSRDAIEFVDRIEGKKVVLIDGPRLADLMIDHNVGVLPTKSYELKEVSNDFFDEDEG
jgi:restriction system protein